MMRMPTPRRVKASIVNEFMAFVLLPGVRIRQLGGKDGLETKEAAGDGYASFEQAKRETMIQH